MDDLILSIEEGLPTPDIYGAIDDLAPSLDLAIGDEGRAQLDAAKAAAKAIIETGSIGDAGDGATLFAVTIFGHANPGHEPVVGEALDSLTVSVRQMLPPAPQ